MTKPKFDEGDLLMIEDATQALMALNDEHFRIIQQKQIDDEKSIAEWLDFLTVLDTYDRIRDTAVQKLRKGSWRNFGRRIAIWGSIIVIGLYILILIVGITPPNWVLYLGIGSCILAGIIYRYSPKGQRFARLNHQLKKVEKLDFPNSIRTYILPLVDFLREESRSDAPLKLFFNFKDRIFQQGKDTLPSNFKTRSGYALQSTDFSVYDLVKISTRLCDGSVLVYQLDDQIRRRYFWRSKYSASGKYKTKTKYKYKTKITHSLRLSIPKKLYILNNSIPPQNESITVDQTESDKRYLFRLKGFRFLKTNLSSTYQPELQDILQLISEVYKRVEKIEQVN